MKCLVVLALALLVVADAHRHWGRPKPRPWGGKSTSVCAGTNPCGSIYRYKEIIKMAGEDCPDSPRRFGREDSDSGSDPETESEEYDQNSSGESSEDDRHGYGGGYGRYKYELAATCDGRCNGIIPTCGACIEDPSTERPGG